MKNIGWKNNQWGEVNDLKISIQDRGLKFSDGIFETVLIKKNKPILLEEHLNRLQNSLNILNYNIKINKVFLKKIVKEGISKLNINNNEYGSIRINYSRGVNLDRSINIDKLKINFDKNNLWIEFFKYNLKTNPISVQISKTEKRNEYSLLNKCKTFNYIQSIQALIEANKNNFDDSLLLNTNNELCCGTTFNILLKRENEWLTPRKKSGCLPGIMVNKLLDLKLIKEALIYPDFKKEDILIAINSLSCRQIKKINNLELVSQFDTKYFWDNIYI